MTWQAKQIQQLNGDAARISLPAQWQILTESWTGDWLDKWGRVAAIPHIVYIPEKDQILMMVSCGVPHHAKILTSDDHGATWSQPWDVNTDDAGEPDTGMGVALVYMGGGRLSMSAKPYLHEDESRRRWVNWTSDDYGKTWTSGEAINVDMLHAWDPPFIERDASTGEISRIWETSYIEDSSREIWSQSYLRHSDDQGRTWSERVAIPQWSGSNEVLLIRAANGNLVAAHRTDIPEKFITRDPETGKPTIALDVYEGLSVSISEDNGRTWSDLTRLFEWGRHHFSMVLLPDGAIVLTYASRKGYVETSEGYPQFGVEAVVSRDHGKTWDLDHRYILGAWPGDRTDEAWSWARCSQKTSSVLLPDGDILTCFGTGFRATVPDEKELRQTFNPRDVGLVRWRVNNEGLNDDTTVADAPMDSDLRNRFDPSKP